MKLNREQILCLLVLVVAGWLVVRGERYAKVQPPNAKPADAAPALRIPEIQFAGKDEPKFSADGRDFFLPPRDWNPLAPLQLPIPPLAEIGAVGPLPSIVPAPSRQGALRRPPLLALAAAPAAESGTGGTDGSGAPADSGPNASAPSGSDESAEPAPVAQDKPAGKTDAAPSDDHALEQSYDWILLKGQRRLWGHILNPDKFKLLDDPGLAVEFEPVNPATGKTSGKAPFTRDRLTGEGAHGQGFGFADTVENAVKLLARETTAGAVAAQLASARKCLEWVKKDARTAIAGADQFVANALAADAANPDAWVLKARVREIAFDREGELAVIAAAKAKGVDNSRLKTRSAALQRGLGLYERARQTLEAAIAENPADADALRELGRLRLDLGEGAEAVDAFDRALKISSVGAEEKLALRLDLIRALIWLDDRGRAQQELARLKNVEVESADAFVATGVLALLDRKLDEALGAFRSALEIDPRHRGAVFDLGIALLWKGEVDAAKARFAEAAEIDPLTQWESHLADGIAAEMSGSPESAAQGYEAALRADPLAPFAHYRAGRGARRLGDLDAARSHLKVALAAQGERVDVINELGYLELLSDQPEAAEQYFRESLRREPQHRAIGVLLGDALLAQNRVAEAKAAFAAVAPADDKRDADPAALCGLAFCEYREGAVDESMARFAEARAAATAAAKGAPDPSADPFFTWANTWQAAIDDHRKKEEWVDRFDRAQIKNNWGIVDSFGATIAIEDATIHLAGTQKSTDPDAATELSQPTEGALFVSFEAVLTPSAQNEATSGIRYVFEKLQQRQNAPFGEIAIARSKDGKARVFVREDWANVKYDWVEAPGITLAAGEPHKFTIEKIDSDSGTYRLKIDDKPVTLEKPNGDFVVGGLRKVRSPTKALVFASGKAREKIDVLADDVRIVRYAP